MPEILDENGNPMPESEPGLVIDPSQIVEPREYYVRKICRECGWGPKEANDVIWHDCCPHCGYLPKNDLWWRSVVCSRKRLRRPTWLWRILRWLDRLIVGE